MKRAFFVSMTDILSEFSLMISAVLIGLLIEDWIRSSSHLEINKALPIGIAIFTLIGLLLKFLEEKVITGYSGDEED